MASSVRRQCVSIASKSLLAIGVLLALLLLPAFSAAQAPEGSTPEIGAREVSEYRKDFPGVSAAQAEARLETQRKGAGIVNQLKGDLGPDYAGIWFDNEVGEFVVPLLAGANRGSVHAEFAGAKLENDYRTVSATDSWAELQAAHERIDKALAPLFEARILKTWLDPRANSVVVELAKGAGEDQRETAERLAARESVGVDVREAEVERFNFEPLACKTSAPRTCGKPLRGGVFIERDTEEFHLIGECSAGFKAIGNVYGNRFILTAGHCAELFSKWGSQDANENFHSIGSVESYSFPTHDWGKIKANGSYWDTSPWPSQVAHYWEDQNRAINYEAYSYLGQYVCHSGTNSGTSCGNVWALDVTANYAEGNVYHLTEFGEICVQGGDSGGPAFASNTALGLMSGADTAYPECERPGLYAEITEAADAMGVTVGTRIGGAPGADTDPATDVQPYQAKLNGQVNPNAVETFYRFEWGKSCYCQHTSEVSAGHGANWVSKNATIAGLDPVTKYKFRIRAKSAAGTAYGSEATFTTPPAPPKSTTEGHSNVRVEEETGKATLHGKINPGGADTDYRFEWGTVASGEFANSAPVPDGDAGDGIDYKSVQAGIEGLKGLTEYQYRLHAENSEGDDTGSVKKFTTPDWRPGVSAVSDGKPYVEEEQGKVELKGKVNPKGFATDYRFEWGTGEEFEEEEFKSIPVPDEEVGTGQSDVEVQQAIEVKGETEYRYRLVAENQEGITESEVHEFTTPSWRPGIVAVRDSGVRRFAAKLAGAVKAKGFATTFSFEYGKTAEYGQSVPAESGEIGSGVDYVDVVEAIEGLEETTTYHFRLVAENKEGTSESEDRVFTTADASIISFSPEAEKPEEEFGYPASLFSTEGTSFAMQVSGWGGCQQPELTDGGQEEPAEVWSGVGTTDTTCAAAGFPGDLEMNGCGFDLYPGTYLAEGEASGTADIGGPQCQEIELTYFTGAAKGFPLCEFTIPPQVGLRAEYEKAEAPNEERVLVRLHGNQIKYSSHSSYCGKGTFYTGSLDATWEVASESLLYGEELGLRVSSETIPAATTDAASGITAHEATLHGTVNPNGGAGSTYRFAWGTSTSYGNTTEAVEAGEGGEDVAAEEALEGLSSGFTYHYRVVASNSDGIVVHGADETFTTVDLRPESITEDASAVGPEEAILNATVNPRGLATTYQFEYGKNQAYGTKVPIPAEDIGEGEEAIEVDEAIEGLQTDTTYHFRITATNAEGTSYGKDESFKTTNHKPVVETGQAVAMSDEGDAVLRGTVDPSGEPTTYQFEYGLDDEYGSKAPASAQGAGKGEEAIEVGAAVEGLEVGRIYHFRIAATNSAGTSYGEDRTFVSSATQFEVDDTGEFGEAWLLLRGALDESAYLRFPNGSGVGMSCSGGLEFEEEGSVDPFQALIPTEMTDSTCTGAEFPLAMNGCRFEFAPGGQLGESEWGGSVAVGPPGCGPITTKYDFLCPISYPAQDGIGATFLDEGEDATVKVTASTYGFKYSQDSICGQGTHAGEFTATWELQASDVSEESVDLYLDGLDPTALTEPASAVVVGPATEATLNGLIHPAGEEASYRFEYDTVPYAGTEEHGTATPEAELEASEGEIAVGEAIEGLKPSRTYHYRVVAIHGEGEEVYGENETFTTAELHAPRFEAEEYPASIAGTAPLTFTTGEYSVLCEATALEGALSSASGELDLEAAAPGCEAAELPTDLHMNSCEFNLAAQNAGPPYEGALGIACEEPEDRIEFRVYAGEGKEFEVCNVKLAPQEGLEGIELANTGEASERGVELGGKAEGIAWSQSGLCGEAEGEAGTLAVESTLSGEEEAKEPLGVYIAGEELAGLYLLGEESEAEAEQPRFASDEYPASITGFAPLTFTTGEYSVLCEATALEGALSSASGELDLEAAAPGCEAAELPTDLHMNSCEFNLAAQNAGPPYEGALGIACEEPEDQIEFRVYAGEGKEFEVCNVKLAPQEGLEGIELANTGEASERGVELGGKAEGIAWSQSGLCGAAEGEAGALGAEVTLVGAE